MPLGLLSVAAGIDRRHEVKILDASSMTIEETQAAIAKWWPDVVGISATTHRAYPMKAIIEDRLAPYSFAVGGTHVTHYKLATYCLGADVVFKGDGDISFGAWIEDGAPPIHRRGLCLNQYHPDLNALPFPRYDLLDMADYTVSKEDAADTLFGQAGVRATMISSKGCPYSCTFCDTPERTVRFKNPKRVVDEMEYLLSLGATSIHIMDDCFNINRERVLGICDEIQKRKLKVEWSARGRAQIDSEVAINLSKAGCRRLHVGIESLDPTVLRWMNKRLPPTDVDDFAFYCRLAGIEILAYFIIGSPNETRESRLKLPDQIRQLGIKYPFFNILYPFPHTAYYDSLLVDGTFEKDYWAEFARNPTRDYVLPLPRPKDLQDELEATVGGYIKEFYGMV